MNKIRALQVTPKNIHALAKENEYKEHASEKNSCNFPIGLSLINFLPHASQQYHFH